MEELALKLLELIARSLHLRPDRLHGFFGDDQTTYMRVNRYPPCPRPDLALGLGRHKDSGALTILLQDDDVGGLDVRRRTDGEWVRVEPVRGSFVVNVGDIVQVRALPIEALRPSKSNATQSIWVGAVQCSAVVGGQEQMKWRLD